MGRSLGKWTKFKINKNNCVHLNTVIQRLSQCKYEVLRWNTKMYVLPHGLYDFTTVLHGHSLISSSINCVDPGPGSAVARVHVAV